MKPIRVEKPSGIPEFSIKPLLRESLPNVKAEWCECKGARFEDQSRFMDDGSCDCGVFKHHVHRNVCGHITQVG